MGTETRIFAAGFLGLVCAFRDGPAVGLVSLAPRPGSELEDEDEEEEEEEEERR